MTYVSDNKAVINLDGIELLIKRTHNKRDEGFELFFKYKNGYCTLSYNTEEERNSTYEKVKAALLGGESDKSDQVK